MPLGPTPPERQGAIFITASKEALIRMLLESQNMVQSTCILGPRGLGCKDVDVLPPDFSYSFGTNFGAWLFQVEETTSITSCDTVDRQPEPPFQTNMLYLLAFTLKVWFFPLVVHMQASLQQ